MVLFVRLLSPVGDEGIRRWTRWLREDSSSRPYAWLRPDFVPPSPFLVIKDPPTQSSQIIVEPHLVDTEFRKAWMPYFCRSGHPQVSAEQSDHGTGIARSCSCQEVYCRWSGWLGLE